MDLSKLYPLREDLRFLSERFSDDNQDSVTLRMSDVDFKIADISYGDMGLIDTAKYQNLKIDTYEMAVTMRKLKSDIETLEEFLNEEIYLAQGKKNYWGKK